MLDIALVTQATDDELLKAWNGGSPYFSNSGALAFDSPYLVSCEILRQELRKRNLASF